MAATSLNYNPVDPARPDLNVAVRQIGRIACMADERVPLGRNICRRIGRGSDGPRKDWYHGYRELL